MTRQVDAHVNQPVNPVVETEIAGLADLGLEVLQVRWVELYGIAPPKKMRRDFLRRGIAHAIQVKAYGGLKPATVRRLKRLAAELASGRPLDANSGSSLRPGTRLMREWNGTMHMVEVTETGFRWLGKDFTSLSAVATAIAGVRWSGPRFFGLKQQAAGNGRCKRRPAR